jgi:hypothetical protein
MIDFSNEELIYLIRFVDPDKFFEEDGEIVISIQDSGDLSGQFLPMEGEEFWIRRNRENHDFRRQRKS